MKIKTSLILFLFIAFALLLSACGEGPTAAQIQAQGGKYAEISDADQRARNAEQLRLFKSQDQSVEMSKAQYKLDLWNTWKPQVIKLGSFAIFMAGFTVFTVALTVSWTSGYLVVMTGKAAAFAVTIRAGVVPIDSETRLPRTIIRDTSHMLPRNSWLAKVQDRTGIQLVNTHGTKWTAFNGTTGQVVGRMDQDRPADSGAMEVFRQALLTNIITKRQNASKIGSPHGEVAQAIGNASPTIPGPSLFQGKFLEMVGQDGNDPETLNVLRDIMASIKNTD